MEPQAQRAARAATVRGAGRVSSCTAASSPDIGLSLVLHPETIMKVALIGASGQAGSRILAELTRRSHRVTDKTALAVLLKGHDAVVSAVCFAASDPKLIIEAVKESGVKRYFVVGGAGSLEVAPGVKLVDTPQFPAAYKAEATKGGEFLDLLRKEKELEWTFLSPSAMVGPGERTGKFRLGRD
jgi:putative NADH-flavin reductase